MPSLVEVETRYSASCQKIASSQASVPDLCGSEIEGFLDAVQQHPCVYDTKRMDYRDAERKINAWEQIRVCNASASTGIVYVSGHAVHSAPVCCLVFPVSVDECLKLWKRLRDRYTRELKAIEATKKKVAAATCLDGPGNSRSPWPFTNTAAVRGSKLRIFEV